MTNENEVKRWKKKTWKNIDVLMEDTFYARTPDLIRSFPPTSNAKYEVIGENEMRSTLEEIPLDPLPEPTKEKTNEATQENLNEETIKENPQLDSDKPPKV
jgi:hypothetical protein